MEKAKNLGWFNEIMKSKMLKHENEDPCEMNYKKMFEWLQDEVNELEKALHNKHKEEVLCERVSQANEEAIKECADVANLAYFIADKIKKEW